MPHAGLMFEVPVLFVFFKLTVQPMDFESIWFQIHIASQQKANDHQASSLNFPHPLMMLVDLLRFLFALFQEIHPLSDSPMMPIASFWIDGIDPADFKEGIGDGQKAVTRQCIAVCLSFKVSAKESETKT